MTIHDVATFMQDEMDHEYFEAYEAVHAFLSLTHEGQFSWQYRMLSGSEFNPGPMWSEDRVMAENMAYERVSEAIARLESSDCSECGCYECECKCSECHCYECECEATDDSE